MPTYGYQCLACDNQFEVFQSIKDDPLKVCESCGGELRKRVYPVGIAFKGSGFYVNDYAAKSKSSGDEGGGTAKADAKPEAKTDANSETKTETKSETKAEAPKAASKTPAAA